VRTYVNGIGAYFFSLECDSPIIKPGANLFGLPYKYAVMERRFWTEKAEPTDPDPEEKPVGDGKKFVCSMYSRRTDSVLGTGTTTLVGSLDDAHRGDGDRHLHNDEIAVNPMLHANFVKPQGL